MLRAITFRFLISMLVGGVLGWVISESSYQSLKTNPDRQPERIELVIPAGTAQKVSTGQAVPSLPADMSFVQGDTLVVVNKDITSHQLGPLWVPPGASASLVLDEANSYSYDCTFQPDNMIGLDVQPRLDASTRMQGIIAVGLPTGAILFVYSIVIFPLKPKKSSVHLVQHDG